MTKEEAVTELLYEARSDRVSTAAAKRIIRACKILSVDPLPILHWNEFCDKAGTPYSDKVKRVW